METKRRTEETSWGRLQHRLFRMVSIGTVSDPLSLGYDIFSSLALIVNLTAAFMMTYDHLAQTYGTGLMLVLEVTTAFFGVDYVLRLLTAECLYPNVGKGRAMGKYVISGAGLIDLLSFLPAYLPVMFPGGATAFRMFRVARILRLFRINRYYDSLNVISQVLVRKRQQLLSSFFIILVLMMASSLCLYSVEHDAQPEVFRNAFSGIWWSASTLLTIGYGDIYHAGQNLRHPHRFPGRGHGGYSNGYHFRRFCGAISADSEAQRVRAGGRHPFRSGDAEAEG